jgi:hypothetical protein
MTRTGFLAVKLVVAASLLSAIPVAARAQPVASARPVSGFLSVNAGLSTPTITRFEAAAVDTDGVNRDEFKAD